MEKDKAMQDNNSKTGLPPFGKLMVVFECSGSAAEITRDFERQKAQISAMCGGDFSTLHFASGNEKELKKALKKMFPDGVVK